ncbi:MAG: GRP family sugar transporter [Candidatus Omnitrophica bacterium]|nr:GRP family sugar transporter [Candidatus Omnitrophota bacterium]MDD5573763.1 GRP family sugar transporter [Candidatus Omnitrophota bacterium]
MKSYYFALLTALVWGLVPVFEKIGLSRLTPAAGIFVRCLAVSSGAIVLLIARPQIIPELAQTPFRYIALIIFGGFTANFIGQLLFYNALKDGDVSRVTPIAGAYPLVAFLLGVLILGEGLTVMKVLGIVCVLLGIFLLR